MMMLPPIVMMTRSAKDRNIPSKLSNPKTMRLPPSRQLCMPLVRVCTFFLLDVHFGGTDRFVFFENKKLHNFSHTLFFVFIVELECVVCSTAQDFGVRIQPYGTLKSETIKCTISCPLTRDFSTLVGCFEPLGFTTCVTFGSFDHTIPGCSVTLTVFSRCYRISQKLNGPAPELTPSPCLECIPDRL